MSLIRDARASTWALHNQLQPTYRGIQLRSQTRFRRLLHRNHWLMTRSSSWPAFSGAKRPPRP